MGHIYKNLKVTKEILRLEEVVGEATSQVVIVQDLQVPEPKPEVVSVLDHAETFRITRWTIVPNKVIVEGVIELMTIYEGRTPYQTVHVMHHTIGFSTFAEVPGAEPDMIALPTVQIEHISYDVQPPGDMVQVRIILNLYVRVVSPVQLQVVTNVTGVPGIKVIRETIKAEDVLGVNTNQMILRETLQVPPEKLDVVTVLDYVATPRITRTIVLPNKVVIEGVISIRVVYETRTPYQTVAVLHREVGFEAFVEVRGAEPGMMVVAEVSIEHAAFEVAMNGRAIVARLVIKVTAKVTRVRTLEVVTDVLGLEHCKIIKDIVRVQEVLGEATRQSIVREVLDIPEEKPNAAAVLDYTVVPEVTRIIVIHGKVIVEGRIRIAVVYEGVTPYQTVHVVHFDIPFNDFVIIPEAEPEMTARVDIQVEHVSFDIGTGDPIMAQIVISITARIFQTKQIHVVVDVFCPEEVEKPCIGVITGDWVNVRPTPSTEKPPIATLEKGTQVMVLAIESGWVKVQLSDGRIGWVAIQYVAAECIPKG